MVYCSNCGEKLPIDSLFCPRCGTKAFESLETVDRTISDELKETFTKMSQELEKAFLVARKEMNAAFQTASENIKKSIQKETMACPNSGEKNPSDAIFCYKCGKRIKAE